MALLSGYNDARSVPMCSFLGKRVIKGGFGGPLGDLPAATQVQ
jgi:hypothetical protein